MNTVVLILNFVCNFFLPSYRKIVNVDFLAEIAVLRYLKPKSGYKNACLSMGFRFRYCNRRCVGPRFVEKLPGRFCSNFHKTVTLGYNRFTNRFCWPN